MAKKEIDTRNWQHQYTRGPKLSDELKVTVTSHLHPKVSEATREKTLGKADTYRENKKG